MTCVPIFPNLATRYRPRKPVQPKTVAVCPEAEERPPVGGPFLMIAEELRAGFGECSMMRSEAC